MIDEQVAKLYNVIQTRSRDSLNAKRRCRMESNSDTLNVYLQCAFDHFAQDLSKPFNFMDVSIRMNPIPLDFAGNILKLALALKKEYTEPRELFEELSFMVASCIQLDITRQRIPGMHSLPVLFSLSIG